MSYRLHVIVPAGRRMPLFDFFCAVNPVKVEFTIRFVSNEVTTITSNHQTIIYNPYQVFVFLHLPAICQPFLDMS